MENYLVEFGGNKDGIFRRNKYIQKNDERFQEKVNSLRKGLNNTDVYYTVLMTSEKEREKGLLYGPLYLDLDIDFKEKEDFKKIIVDLSYVVANLREGYGIPEKMIKVYFSGSKGFHVIIEPEILGIEPDKELNDKYKAIAMSLNKKTRNKSIDTRIYDNKRLFRFDCSINSKTGLYKVPIEYRKLKKMSMEKMIEYAKTVHEVEYEKPRLIKKAKEKFEEEIKSVEEKKKDRKARKIDSKIKKEILPCTLKILEEGIEKGSRNNTSVAIASCLFQIRMEEEDIINTMLSWNERNNPPLPEREVYATIKSAGILNNKQRGYGCAYFKENDHCVGKKCHLFNRS